MGVVSTSFDIHTKHMSAIAWESRACWPAGLAGHSAGHTGCTEQLGVHAKAASQATRQQNPAKAPYKDHPTFSNCAFNSVLV